MSFKNRLDVTQTHQAAAIVRGIDGTILFWNRRAEKQYGWSRDQVLGNVTHDLFDTVFPYPLEEINRALLAKGYWQGELIHTMSDGSRVKVYSRWDLQPLGLDQPPQVLEVNQVKELVTPFTSYVGPKIPQIAQSLWRERMYFFLPMILVLVLLYLAIAWSDHFRVLPLGL